MHHFVEKYNRKLSKKVAGCTGEFLQFLQNYNWPGNVRELENIVERAMVITKREQLSAAELPKSLLDCKVGVRHIVSNNDGRNPLPYKQAKSMALDTFNRYYINSLLDMTKGNISQAAEIANMNRSNFKRMMRTFNITADPFSRINKTPRV